MVRGRVNPQSCAFGFGLGRGVGRAFVVALSPRPKGARGLDALGAAVIAWIDDPCVAGHSYGPGFDHQYSRGCHLPCLGIH